MIFSFLACVCERERGIEREREWERERETPFIIDPLQDSFWGCELWAPAVTVAALRWTIHPDTVNFISFCWPLMSEASANNYQFSRSLLPHIPPICCCRFGVWTITEEELVRDRRTFSRPSFPRSFSRRGWGGEDIVRWRFGCDRLTVMLRRRAGTIEGRDRWGAAEGLLLFSQRIPRELISPFSSS